MKDVEIHVQDGERTLKIFLTDIDTEGKDEVHKEMSNWSGLPNADMSSDE